MAGNDDAVGNVKAQSRSFTDRLRREKRIEDFALNIFGNARAVIGDFDDDVLIRIARFDRDGSLVFDGANGVVEEVGPHLVQFASIHSRLGQFFLIVANDFNARRHLVAQNGQGVVDAHMDIDFLGYILIHIGIGPHRLDEIGNASTGAAAVAKQVAQFQDSTGALQSAHRMVIWDL